MFDDNRYFCTNNISSVSGLYYEHIYLYDPVKLRLKHQRKVQQKEGCHAVVPPKSGGSTAPAVVPPTLPGIEQKEEEQDVQAAVLLHSTACPVLPGNLVR